MRKNSLASETAALSALQRLLADAAVESVCDSRSIQLRCGNFTVPVTRCVKAPGKDKADFVLLNGDQPQLFISHKARGFSHNGYGSGGKKAFAHRSPYHDREIWEFVRWAADYCQSHHEIKYHEPGIFQWVGKTRGVWCVPPVRVQNLIVYGPEYGSSSYGPFNCHIAGVGDPRLARESDGWRLSFSDSTCSNGEIPDGGDTPIIAVAGRTPTQSDIYLTHPDSEGHRGFYGWLGFFPQRIIRVAGEREAKGKSGGKGDNLEKVEWPFPRL